MYEFQDLTPISGHLRTNFKISGISGQRPGLHRQNDRKSDENITSAVHYVHLAEITMQHRGSSVYRTSDRGNHADEAAVSSGPQQ